MENFHVLFGHIIKVLKNYKTRYLLYIFYEKRKVLRNSSQNCGKKSERLKGRTATYVNNGLSNK